MVIAFRQLTAGKLDIGTELTVFDRFFLKEAGT